MSLQVYQTKQPTLKTSTSTINQTKKICYTKIDIQQHFVRLIFQDNKSVLRTSNLTFPQIIYYYSIQYFRLPSHFTLH